MTQEVQDALLAKAKAVAVATSGLVQNAKTKGTATSQLVACTMVTNARSEGLIFY